MSPLSGQWRGLQDLAGDPRFLARASEEFPGLADALACAKDRRSVIRLTAAVFAMAALAGCDIGPPGGKLIPAVRSPADIIAGLPNFYATAFVLQGYAEGIVVKHHMGRPIKVEGNPKHPASLGATDAFAQAQVLDFYDPERAWGLMFQGAPASMAAFEVALEQQRASIAASRGQGFCILTGAVSSPTLAAQINDLLKAYPQARWRQWEPVSRANVFKGAALAYGRPIELIPKLEAADVLLAIDSDIISSAPGHLRFARDFSSRRNPTRTAKMSRVYAVEPTPTLIGAAADHRFVAGPQDLDRIVVALAGQILRGSHASDVPEWVAAIVADLRANQGRALIHVGPDQSPETHALVYAMNERLGARGATLELVEPVLEAQSDALSDLVDDMRAGRVTTLLIIDSNPVYAAPQHLGFAEALKQVKFSLASTLTPNETSAAALWAAPLAHAWESWSDARAYDGTASVLQPQALPLFGAMDVHELLAKFVQGEPFRTLERVQATWKARIKGDFPQAWREALATGVLAVPASQKTRLNLRPETAKLSPPARPAYSPALLFRPDPQLWDGRFANNPWLHETPRPFTKLTWDNPLLIAPGFARRLDLQNGDVASVSVAGAETQAPVWVMPGQAEDCVVAYLGGGRRGSAGVGLGFDFSALMGRAGVPALRKAQGRETLACTEHHNVIFSERGDYAKHATLDAFVKDGRLFAAEEATGPSLYRWRPPGPAAWAMSVDLNACIGCNACIVACQAENNVPVVGKEEVIREREMHWLRIDRYYEGDSANPEIYLQPTLCMHCEQAPCETVCPVGATVHDSEGLNVMVYNRCIGTRFCSNNCPYKVRRFNYFDFADKERRPIEARNPDVTVRARGVMEKCTFCLQRIAEARIAADRDGAPIGEATTACQAACPTKAFTFGNMAAADSEVAKRKQSPLDYALLADQNTHPRVTYEARIRNLNPAIGGKKI